MVDAQAVLAAGLAEAAETDRLVFLHAGAEWCGWCKRLEAWMVREDVAPIFFKFAPPSPKHATGLWGKT